jgi:hypothetical protein
MAAGFRCIQGFARLGVITLLAALSSFVTVAVAAAQTCPSPAFGPSVPIVIPLDPGGELFDLVVADFNGDSLADAAVASSNGHRFDILLAQNGGTWARQGTHLSALILRSLVAADFNQDAHLDLVLAYENGAANTTELRALPGLGDGTFGPPSTIAVPQSVTKLVAGDFTGDGLQDFVAFTEAPGAVANLFPGDGAGGFGIPVGFPVGGIVKDAVSGDFNGDTRPDIAVAVRPIDTTLASSIRILFGTAAGGFTGPTVLPVEEVVDLEVGDLDGDGDLDLALSVRDLGIVSTLRGDGVGGFTGGGVAAVYAGAGRIAVEDFNGDGIDDLAVANERTESFPFGLTAPIGTLDVLYGDGGGGFSGAASFSVGESIRWLAASDVNDDGRVDLVALTHAWSNSVEEPLAAVAVLNSCGTADAAVAVTDSADPVQTRDEFHYIVDVSNSGPDAAPLALRMRVDGGTFGTQTVTTTHGRCRHESSTAGFEGLVMCWLGILEPGETAQVVVQATESSMVTRRLTARVTSGGHDPDVSNNQDVETTRVTRIGGGGLELEYQPGGSVELSWSRGDFQAAYYIGRFVGGAMTVLPASGIPLPADATSFVDDSPIVGEVNCYVVTPVDAAGTPIGRSDMLCVKPGSATGQAPPRVSIELNGSESVFLRWSPPGGQTGYMLIAHSLATGEQTQISTTSIVRQHLTNGMPFCYVIIPGNGVTPLGASDQFCAFPGVADLDLPQ